MKRVIITGAPSSGKSTVLAELKNLGYSTFDECARLVIREQLLLQSEKVPWLNNEGFSDLVVHKQIADHQNADSVIQFYDRGIPDVLAYFKFYDQLHLISKYEGVANQFRYHNIIFLLPPWKKIYDQDTERKESFEQAKMINSALISTYTNLGYKIEEVPQVNPKDRAKFILESIEEQ